MKLIALLVGLAVERLATQLFHLRRLRWLDRILDSGYRYAADSVLPPLVSIAVLAVLLVAPVALAIYALGDAVYGLVYLVLAVVVLFFSLGPKDIGEQVDDYCAALKKNDEQAIAHTAKALVERDVAAEPGVRIAQVEAAVCVQANNRLFAVIFWFVILGPLGAWGYRVTDLIRRRGVFNAGREEQEAATGRAAAQASAGAVKRDDESENESKNDSDEDSENSEADADAGPEADAAATGTVQSPGDIVAAAEWLHGWLAWIPARLTALGYALGGSFDEAIAAWRRPVDTAVDSPSERSEDLLARVGVAALALWPKDEETPAERGIRGALAANALVFRLLGIWAFVIAAMTLYGAFV